MWNQRWYNTCLIKCLINVYDHRTCQYVCALRAVTNRPKTIVHVRIELATCYMFIITSTIIFLTFLVSTNCILSVCIRRVLKYIFRFVISSIAFQTLHYVSLWACARARTLLFLSSEGVAATYRQIYLDSHQADWISSLSLYDVTFNSTLSAEQL